MSTTNTTRKRTHVSATNGGDSDPSSSATVAATVAASSVSSKTASTNQQRQPSSTGRGGSMFFLPRLAVLLASAFSLGQLYQAGPAYLEPLYGNVFSRLAFMPMACLFFASGAIRGYVQVRFPGGKPNDTPAIRRLRTWRILAAMLDTLSVLLGVAPYTVNWLFRWSGTMGPLNGPHITQLFLTYSAFALLGVVNGIACFSGRASVLPSARIAPSAIVYATGLAAITWLSTHVEPTHCCETLLWQAGLNSVLSIFIKLIVTEALRQKITANNAGQPEAAESSMMPSRLTLRYAPQFIVTTLVALVLIQHPQCQRGFNPSKHVVPGNNYTMHDRIESITGQLSVVDESTRNFRMLRSGHSLIGGQYLTTNDSIYASFYYMEAGRLLRDRKNDTKSETALSLGLGIGVSATSLLKHGMTVDIVEIDPMVYHYAREYFGLPEPRHAFLEDGRAVVTRAADHAYDYILHDVFSGGSVPKRLFSLEFIKEIRRVLKPDGVLTLNFVGCIEGDDSMAMYSIWRTLQEVFPHVAVFKEAPRTTSNAINVVFMASTLPIEFRAFVEDDYLDSDMRYHAFQQLEASRIEVQDLELLNKADIVTDEYNRLDQWQYTTALEHWQIMRNLLPLEYWLNY
ncbi:S-adenosyl-L-methionine-dependent methyltransferase [Syncephalis plumigaleata]|nr:S-adenosyl-L-methionine-dependent methyltransferase [Syncephalis plumigaleata]